jgi:c-di-GMP-binding flagellar brake protein YcgR
LIEKRKYIRLKAPIGVTYGLVKKSKRQRSHLTFLKDIGGGGIRIMAKEELRPGDLLEVEIQIPLLEDPIHAVGEVVWYEQFNDRDRQIREAGVRLMDIEPTDLHQILEYVHHIGIG